MENADNAISAVKKETRYEVRERKTYDVVEIWFSSDGVMQSGGASEIGTFGTEEKARAVIDALTK